MKTLLKLFFIFATLTSYAAEDLEVRLSTKANLKPIYVSAPWLAPNLSDWRYAEELRNVLVFDLSHNGYTSIAPSREEREENIKDRSQFDLLFWRKEKIPFVISISSTKEAFSVTLFQVDKGTSKRYPEIPLTGTLDSDRSSIHELSDLIQKDLFGKQGIASKQLLYSQRMNGPDGWLSHIWICDADGVNARPLARASGYCMSPGFLPSCIAGAKESYYYVSEETGQSKIYRTTLSDARPNIWIRLRGNQLLPAISPCGKQLAFITDVAGRPDLFLQKLDKTGAPVGPPRQLFSAPNATQASPSFSPDGTKIVFVSDKEGSARIYQLSIPSAKETKRPQPRLLTRKNRENTSPAYSPDGTRLAYSARTDGVRQIWIYDFETGEEWQLTQGPENKENPSWAPDSLHLIYNTETEDVSELFMIDLHMQEPYQISSGFGQKRFPCWEQR